MDGPAHYVEAEKSFHKAKEAARLTDGASAVLYMQAAQWHAIMALTAATAGKNNSDWMYAYYREEGQAQDL
jgi:hypothetical protein